MKLTKKEIQKITEIYDLGKVKNIRLIDFGLVNYNYELKTEKGEFILRVIGYKMDENKKNKLKLEFGVLKYLRKKRFQYKFPEPIKNKRGKEILRIGKKNLWVYKKIPGEIIRDPPNTKKLKEIARALAIYHKTVKGFKFKKVDRRSTWLLLEYEKMKKINPKNKLDKLILENIEFFNNQLKKVLTYSFKGNLLPVHKDFHAYNMVYERDKIIGILDFDNINYAPKIKDLGYSMRLLCISKNKLDKRKFNLFLREYEKINKLTKKEKSVIIPIMIESNCTSFWWVYKRMNKEKHIKYKLLKYTIESTKNLAKELDKHTRE